MLKKKFFNIVILLVIVIILDVPLYFGDYNSLSNIIVTLISVALGMFCLINREVWRIAVKPYGFINKFFLCFFLFLMIEISYGYIGGVSFISVLNLLYKYSWLLLFFPIVYILKTEDNKVDLLKKIFILSIVSLLFQTYFWWLFSFKGKDMAHYLLFKLVRTGWWRNGFLRVPPNAFSGFIFSFSIYLFFTNKKLLIKLFGLSVIVFYVWYILVVTQLRNGLITVLVTAVVVLIFVKKNFVLKAFILIMSGILLWYLLKSEFMLNFINSLNDSSVGVRKAGVNYFFNLFLENFLLGCRVFMLSDGNIGFYFSDMGILVKFAEFGIIGGVLFIIPLGRFFWIVFKTYKKEKNIIFYISLFVFTLSVEMLTGGGWILFAFHLACFEVMYEKNIVKSKFNM